MESVYKRILTTSCTLSHCQGGAKAAMNNSYFYKRFRLICFFIVFCFSGCIGLPKHPSSGIYYLAWDQDSVLFMYEYLKQGIAPNEPRVNAFETNTYRASLNRNPSQALEIWNPTSSKEKLPFFPFAPLNYIRENKDKFKPHAQELSLKQLPDSSVFANYQPQNGLILLENYNNMNSTYSLVNVQDNTFRNLQLSDQIESSGNSNRILIQWIGFENDVLVEYKKDDQMFHGLAEIDIESAKLINFKVFKQYKANLEHGPYDPFYISKQDDAIDVKILGLEGKETVYYLEKPAYSQQVKVLKQTISNGQIQQLGTIDKEKSYYPELQNRSQISMIHKKVVYPSIESWTSDKQILLVNFDGTDQKVLVSQKRDLPMPAKVN